MFHNISNPKWFGNWSRLEDDYLGNGGTDIADNFTFSNLLFVQIEEGKAYSYVAEYDQYLWVPSKYRRNSDGMKPADRKGLVGSEDFALLCWDSVNHLPAIRRISLKASLTSRLIDFKYLREAEAPAYTHGVSNDILDYEFDDDDDDIPAFSFPEA